MPRARRQVVPGQPVHVIQRGNNRSACFMGADDFRFYLHALQHASARAQCAVHAYVLMPNHVHLLVTPRDHDGTALLMQALGRRFVRYFNASHARTGTLWEGRYRSALVDSDRYYFACSRYIELNPVRAGLASRPGAYAWTSFHRNGGGLANPLISPHPLYLALGECDRVRERAYRELFTRALDPVTIDAIRRATNAGRRLGDADATAARQPAGGEGNASSNRRRL